MLERRRKEGEQEGVGGEGEEPKKKKRGKGCFYRSETGQTQGRPGGAFASHTGVSVRVRHARMNRTTHIVCVDLWRMQGRSGSAFAPRCRAESVTGGHKGKAPLRPHKISKIGKLLISTGLPQDPCRGFHRGLIGSQRVQTTQRTHRSTCESLGPTN